MEAIAYLEKIYAYWWLFLLAVLGSLWPGSWISTRQTSLSSVTAVLYLNGVQQIQANLPSSFVFLNPVSHPEFQIMTAAQLTRLGQMYPQLTVSELQKNIHIISDGQHQLVLITVTDTSATRAATIANYLAQHFIVTQLARMHAQLTRSSQWLQQNILIFELKVAHLQQSFKHISGRISYQQKSNLNELQHLEYRLSTYQTGLKDLHDISNLLQNSYQLLQPARASNALTWYPLPEVEILLICGGISQVILLCILLTLEYSTPRIRHAGELERLIGARVLLTISKNTLRSGASIDWQSALGTFNRSKKKERHCSTILYTGNPDVVTSSGHLAAYLARQGQHTLFINNFTPKIPIDHRGPLKIFKRVGFSHIYSSSEIAPFILKNYAYTPLTSLSLIEILPELQKMFDWIIIAAPSMTEPETRLLSSRATRTWIQITRRLDLLKEVKAARDFCQRRAIQHDYLLYSNG